MVGCPSCWAIIRKLVRLYAIVPSARCRVYVLFGKVLGVLDEPGLHFLPAKLGLQGLDRAFFGWGAAAWSTCGSTRNTCAASR
jgi:hypothetical protein